MGVQDLSQGEVEQRQIEFMNYARDEDDDIEELGKLVHLQAEQAEN